MTLTALSRRGCGSGRVEPAGHFLGGITVVEPLPRGTLLFTQGGILMQRMSCELLDLVELVLGSEDLHHSRQDGAVHVPFEGENGEKRIRFEQRDSVLSVFALAPGFTIRSDTLAELLGRVNDWNCTRRWPRARITEVQGPKPILVGDHHLLTHGTVDLQNVRAFVQSIIAASLDLLDTMQREAPPLERPPVPTRVSPATTDEFAHLVVPGVRLPMPSAASDLAPGYL